MIAMRATSTHTYAAPPDRVFQVLTDPDVAVAKYTSLGHRDVRVAEHTVVDGAVVLRSTRSVPMEVPGFAKRILSPMNAVRQCDRWAAAGTAGERTGTWEVTASGVPVSVRGTLRLTPSADGTTTVEITADVTCSLPLVGGKLATFVGNDVVRTIDAEIEFNVARLAEQPTRTKKPRH
jgi:carbon monoxide dehydrogenase subunit G